MARLVAWAFAALLLVSATGSGAECEKGQNPATKAGAPSGQPNGRGNQGHPPPFWVDPKLKAELGITDAQAEKIDAIWRKDSQQRADARTKLEKLETQLDQMMLDATLDESAFMTQLEKVEAARTEASKARNLMLYRIYRVLSPDQRAKLAAKAKAMREQRPDGGRGGDHR